ncbi:hypothetical protein OG876_01460 [Kribbella sp. NBC_00359]
MRWFGVCEQCSVDNIQEASFECSEGLGFGVAGFAASLEVGDGVGVVVGLGDRDAVDGGVDLAVARASFAVA